MFNLEKIERMIIAVLTVALLAGVGVTVYKQSRPVPIQVKRFNPEDYKEPISAAEQAALKINLNMADAGEIAKLKGVGIIVAARIVEYRDRNGLFIAVEDIKKVKGIGDALFQKIKNNITTE